MAKIRDFGTFELHEKLASGGMATVYRGVQKSLARPVVLKILHPHLAEDAEFVTRFEREAHAAASLRHENIVQIIDCGRHEGTPFIAMELVDGNDLRQWMERRGVPPLEVALLILRAVADGLDFAHRSRLIHRDIKPANVMLARDGSIKLTDFGLAKSTESMTVVTLTGSVLGTPAYMSPEQASGDAADERSDLFSLGVVAYEMLGGTRPFRGNDSSAIIHAILTVDPPRLESINPTVPEEIADLVRRLLEKDRLRRPASAGAARDEIETALETMGVRRGRALLVEYFADPETVSQRLRKSRRERHLNQGIYYETLGLGRIDDAIREFRRVLHLDPKDATAREHMAKLERERLVSASAERAAARPAVDSEATTVFDEPIERAQADSAALRPPAAPETTPAAGARRTPALGRGVLVGAAVLIVVIAGGYALLRGLQSEGGPEPEPDPNSTIIVRRLDNPSSQGAPPSPGDHTAAIPRRDPPQTADSSRVDSTARKGVESPATAKPPVQSPPKPPTTTNSTPTRPSETPKPTSRDVPRPPSVQTAPPPTSGVGSLRISSSGTWAYVYLDGRKTGKTTPCLLESIASGSHSLFLVREGFEMTGGPRTITVEGGKTTQVDVPMRPQ